MTTPAANHPFLDAIVFDAQGLVPIITQDHQSGEVLMMAWANREALQATLAEGVMVYWSRSRGSLWRKGETSGQVQRLVELRLDCDGDSVLARVEQTGVACHTGRWSCFYRKATEDGLEDIAMTRVDPATLYG